MSSPRRIRPRVFWTIDPALLARLRERARKRGVAVSHVVEEALRAALILDGAEGAGEGRAA